MTDETSGIGPAATEAPQTSKRIAVTYSATNYRHGDIRVEQSKNGIVITVIDKVSGQNTRRAQIHLHPRKLMDLGNLLVQLAFGTDMDEAEIGENKNGETFTGV